MSLFDTIQQNMYAAMKSGEQKKAVALRGVISKLKDKRIEKRNDLTEQEEIQVIRTLTKQRQEAIELYTRAGRNDLVETEKFELQLLESYLPKMMDEAELKQIIEAVIKETGAVSTADIGKVMPEVMKRTKGRADGKTAQAMVRQKLAP